MEGKHRATASFCHEEGGVLTIPGSGVILRVPPKAVPPGEEYIIHGMVHTDLEEYHPLMSSDDEVIVGPVPEFIVESGGTFNEPVDIVIPHNQQLDKLRNIRVLYGEKGQYTSLQANDSDISYSADRDHICIHTKHFTRFVVTSTGRKEEITEALFTVAASRKEAPSKSITQLRVMLHTGSLGTADFQHSRKKYYDADMEEIIAAKVPLPETEDAIAFPMIFIRLRAEEGCDAVIKDADFFSKDIIRYIAGEHVLRLPKSGNPYQSEILSNFTVTSVKHQQLQCEIGVKFDYREEDAKDVVMKFQVIYPS